MAIDFRKLLTTNIKTTRWSDIINVFQNYLYNTLKTGLFNQITDKWKLDRMTDQNFRDLAYTFGFELTQGEGYTETSSYLSKEAQTLVQRISKKHTHVGYLYIYYIFLTIGLTYPMVTNDRGTLEPWLEWLSDPETESVSFLLDTGLTLDADDLWTLDELDIRTLVTRHLMLRYTHRFVENETEFLSLDSMRAFFNDVIQMKRSVEFPHYEAKLDLNADSIGNDYLTRYTSEDGTTINAYQTSKYFGVGDLTTATTVEFGTGGQSTPYGAITGVQTLDTSYLLTAMVVIDQTATKLEVRHDTDHDFKINGFTELAVKDGGGNVLYYSKFPKINFHPTALSSAYLTFNVI